ncbi:MAG: CHAT domain-containing protein [Candidatus Competibacter sp.]|nr:CHAT domain-containing protein [Candidatus Competibacter sp.]MDG4584155.1 CHAT domain-containing protein [Candidatus Competibacter sp.]
MNRNACQLWRHLSRVAPASVLGLQLLAPATVAAEPPPAAGVETQTRQIDALLQQAGAYRASGRSRDALAALRAARPLAESLDDPARHAAVLGELGETLRLTGAREDARRMLENSVALARHADAPDIAAASLNHLGNLAAGEGDIRAARAAYQDGLTLARRAQDAPLTVAVLINGARLAARTGEPRRADALLDEAAQLLPTLPASRDKVYRLLAVGQLRRTLPGASARQRAQSLRDFTAAASMARALDDRPGLSHALGYQAQLQQDEGHPAQALALYRQAAFAAQQAEAPELLYRWQWAIGRRLAAQGDRDGAILAYQQAVTNLQAIRQDFVPMRAGETGSFRTSVGDAFLELADLLLQRAARQSMAAAREADLRAARDTMEALKTAEVKDYFQDDCVVALQARTVDLDRPPPRTAVLYPIPLPDRLELLLHTEGGLRQVTVRVDHAAFTEAVRGFRRYLEKRTSREYLPLAQRLHGWLIGPLQGELDARQVETLVIVPDGPLRTIPLAALHDGEGFLVRRYAVATTPGLTLTDLRPIPRQKIQPLLNGLSAAVQGFPPLDYVRGELDAIHAAYGGTVLEDADFRLANVQRELKETPYSIVHIASHGEFAGDARDTFLLTFDDKLTLDRLERFMSLSQYRDRPVELLTLSACQTAAGDDRAALGLAGVAVKAGARSALATLWFINDQASSLLVTEFYRQLRNPELSKAEALQRAQTRLLADPRYQHPGYWSPFLLIGNWL